MKYNKAQVAKNILLNLAATAAPMLILQVYILPAVNRQIGAEAYGLALTLITLFSIVPACFGNALNNVRLLVDLSYQDKGIEGDFNLLSLILAAASAIATAVVTAIYTGMQSWGDVLWMACGAIFVFAYEYYSVGFRLSLNYKKVLLARLMLALGYYIGYRLFLASGTWQYIYIVGYALAGVYSIMQSGSIREKWHFTTDLKGTVSRYVILLIASLMGGVVGYVDRLVLYPLLGGTMVSVYYASSLFGKLIATGMGPITSVMLSYFSKMRALAKNTMLQMVLIGLVAGVAGYAVCILVCPTVLEYLYPDVAGQAVRYMYITVLTSIIGMLCSIVSPAVLRFCNTKWQLLIGGSNVLLYFVFSLALYQIYGLMGFCVGVLVAKILNMAMLLLIYYGTGQKNAPVSQ